MFGDSRSGESPRLPSPWHQALAGSKHVQVTQESALGLERSPYLGARSMSEHSSRTPSSLSLRADIAHHSDEEDGLAAEGSHGSSQRSGSSSTAGSSVDEDDDMPSWRRSSQNLVIPPGAVGLTKLPAESDTVGQIEYKLKLIAPGPERFDRLTTQLKWRLTEGFGEAIYEIGVMDDGTLIGITRAEMDASLRTLELMAAELAATVMVLRTISLAAAPAPPPQLELAAEGAGGDAAQNQTAAAPPPPMLGKKKERRRKRAYVKKHRSTSDASGSHPPSEHSTRSEERQFTAKERKRFGDRSKRPVYDDVDDSDIDDKTGLGPVGSQTGVAAPFMAPLSSVQLGKQPDLDMPSSDADYPPSIPQSWRARNMERAKHDQDWRHSHETPFMTHDPADDDLDSGADRKRNGKRPWRRKRHPFGDDETSDGDMFFPFDTTEHVETARLPLTAAALAQIPADASHFDTPQKVSKKLQRKLDFRSKRQEQRRMDLIRGDGAGDGALGLFEVDSESEGDEVIKGLLQRIASPQAETFAEATSPTKAQTTVDWSARMATSPSGKTLRAQSPRSTPMFSLPGPVKTDGSSEPIPSPTDTITQPLDSLSLSFAESEVAVADSVVDAMDQNAGGVEGAGSERLIVEALVIKKMDVDERFGFLDYGSASGFF